LFANNLNGASCQGKGIFCLKKKSPPQPGKKSVRGVSSRHMTKGTEKELQVASRLSTEVPSQYQGAVPP